MSKLAALLANNVRWAEQFRQDNPGIFATMAAGQSPQYLWIGCADSRIPANQVTGLLPGEIFVHRNIANVVVHTDSNLLSVVFYAVQVLKVKHIIICGHDGCGGIAAALENESHGFIDNWLTHIKDVYEKHEGLFATLPSFQAKVEALVRLNVKEQMYNIAKISFVQQAWQMGAPLSIHGLVYDISTGLLEEVADEIDSVSGLNKIFHFI